MTQQSDPFDGKEWQTRKCPVCGSVIAQSAKGRYKEYCSPKCRQKAYRDRQDAAEAIRRLADRIHAPIRESEIDRLKDVFRPEQERINPWVEWATQADD